MNKHFLYPIFSLLAVLASVNLMAQQSPLTVRHLTKGNMAAELDAALTSADLTAANVTRLTVAPPVEGEAAVLDSADCVAIRTKFFNIAGANHGPSVLNFANVAFEDNTIKANTFYNGSSAGMQWITEVVLPDNIIAINESAFNSCKILATINFPATLTSIGKTAFRATALTSVVLPEGLTTINESVFTTCNSLAEIVIPSTVTTIGYNAFYRTVSYTHRVITCKMATIPNGNLFGTADGRTNTILRILPSAIYNAAQWTNATIEYITSTGIETVTPSSVSIYPNPTSDFVTVSGAKTPVQLYDSLGRLLLSTTETTIGLTSFSSGIYILKANNQTFKVIKK